MAKKKKRGPGAPPFAQALIAVRGPKLLSPSLLAKMWFVPTYIVESWLKDEPGVLTWERKNPKGQTRISYRVSLELAERIRKKHLVGSRPGPKGSRCTAEDLRQASGA